MKTAKKYIRLFWIASILIGLVLFFLYPNSFTRESLSQFISQNSSHIIWTYLAVSLIRGIFLLPSTPFVLAGILLFPDSPWLVLLLSMIGIMGTALYLYFASRFLEFHELFGKKHLDKTEKITQKLHQHGFWIVLGWAFFPLVPTDLICYIAGSIKMKLFPYLTAIFIGEAILISGYVFFGGSILSYFS